MSKKMAMTNLMLEVSAKTNTGMVRDANEDNFIVTQDCTRPEWILPREPYLNSAAGTVLVVADGMGGLNAGEVASKIAVDSIKEDFRKLVPTVIEEKNIKNLVTNAIVNAHRKIVTGGKTDPDMEGMGSTIVVAWITNNKVYVGWVGDSRCYISRNGKLMQLSKDHSYVQSLVDRGELNKEQAFLHPESNVITQSLGDAERVPKPDFIAFQLANDDIILLCSDGLNSMVRDETIETIVSANRSLAESSQLLIEEANKEGGHDNITILMAKVVGNADSSAPEEIAGKSKKPKRRGKFFLFAFLLLSIGIGSYLAFRSKNPPPPQKIIKSGGQRPSKPANS